MLGEEVSEVLYILIRPVGSLWSLIDRQKGRLNRLPTSILGYVGQDLIKFRGACVLFGLSLSKMIGVKNGNERRCRSIPGHVAQPKAS